MPQRLPFCTYIKKSQPTILLAEVDKERSSIVRIVFFCLFPVDNLEPIINIVGTDIVVFEIVGMFPYINNQNGTAPCMSGLFWLDVVPIFKQPFSRANYTYPEPNTESAAFLKVESAPSGRHWGCQYRSADANRDAGTWSYHQ